ncbi:MAG: zinc ribbon domain-containing protein [Candidatus Omnitrophota bacterium]|nr:zinc ribbon domain-containing protein [Candidatus Omnitrophota bacterium]
MGKVRYRCTHCGRRFEAEDRETLECPHCFWSSSVKREDDVDDRKPGALAPANETHVKKKPREPFKTPAWVRPAGYAALGIAVIALAIYCFMAYWPFSSGSETRDSVEHIDIPAVPESKAGAQSSSLSDAERYSLQNRVLLAPDRTVEADEREALDVRVSFKTGLVEQLPSRIWTLEAYTGLIAEREAFYHVPLSRSYKKKLENLFKDYYLSGETAFNDGDLLKARDLWVRSLVFPIYGDDIQKHRGVVLTMIRPFINDTLSKIGAINTSLVERVIRETEQAISIDYAKLHDLIQKRSWQEASSLLRSLEGQILALEASQGTTGTAPPYSEALTQMDADIRGTLLNLREPPMPAVADLTEMLGDVRRKMSLVDSFIPETLKQTTASYQNMAREIEAGRWREVEGMLRNVNLPQVYANDLRAKIEVAKKMDKQKLASGVN